MKAKNGVLYITLWLLSAMTLYMAITLSSPEVRAALISPSSSPLQLWQIVVMGLATGAFYTSLFNYLKN